MRAGGRAALPRAQHPESRSRRCHVHEVRSASCESERAWNGSTHTKCGLVDTTPCSGLAPDEDVVVVDDSDGQSLSEGSPMQFTGARFSTSSRPSAKACAGRGRRMCLRNVPPSPPPSPRRRARACAQPRPQDCRPIAECANRRAFPGSGGRRGRSVGVSRSECFSALAPAALWIILNSTRVCLVLITPRKGVLHVRYRSIAARISQSLEAS